MLAYPSSEKIMKQLPQCTAMTHHAHTVSL